MRYALENRHGNIEESAKMSAMVTARKWNNVSKYTAGRDLEYVQER